MLKRPDFMKRFRAILAEEKRVLKAKEHARKASEHLAHDRTEEADKELRKAERLIGK